MKKEKKELEEVLKLKIKDNVYEITFPNTGTLIDLERRKSNIGIESSGSISSFFARNLGMAIATFSVLIPSLKEDLNVMDYNSMKLKDSAILVDAYLKQFLPWFNSWMEEISSALTND